MNAGSRRTSASKIVFDSVVTSNSAWFEWIEGANQFQSVLRSKIPWQDLDVSAKTVIKERLAVTSPPSQMLLNSFYVTLVAGFEEYLRSVVRELTARITNDKSKYGELSSELLRLNVRETAKLLRRMESPPDYLNLNVDDLCRQLGSCVPESTHVSLNVDAMAEIDSLIKMENFLKRVQVLGKQIDWDFFGRQSGVKAALKLPHERSARNVANALQAELTIVARFRNRIAHVGSSAADVTSEVVNDHRSLLLALSDTIEASV